MKKAAETTLDPKVFDFTALMGKARKPLPRKVSVFLAVGNLDLIRELTHKITEAQADPAERSMNEADPAETMLEQKNALMQEFNDSEVTFEFRPLAKGDRLAIHDSMREAGEAGQSEDFEDKWTTFAVANNCISPVMTVAEVTEFRAEVGEYVFGVLGSEVLQLFNGSGVRNIPFSLPPSPSLTSAQP